MNKLNTISELEKILSDELKNPTNQEEIRIGYLPKLNLELNKN
jgi:hypothetical protein